MMDPSENRIESSDPDRASPRGKALVYGFVVSLLGLPIGIILQLPAVWVLATIGIVVGGIKLVAKRCDT
jgi:hypothetical protein